MTAKERRKAIYELIKREKHVTVSALKRQFSVSEVTIRKDLEKLELVGTIHRVFGGVTYTGEGAAVAYQNEIPTFGEVRENAAVQNVRSRTQIAKLACTLIHEDEVVFLDSSDISIYIAEQLLTLQKRLLILTNSLKVFEVIKNSIYLKVVLVGGEYDLKSSCFAGELTHFFFKNIHISTAFLSANGFDIHQGAEVHPSLDLYVKKAVATAAASVVVLAEHQHFTKHGTVILLPWSRIHKIVTNQSPPNAFFSIIQKQNIELLYDVNYVEEGYAD